MCVCVYKYKDVILKLNKLSFTYFWHCILKNHCFQLYKLQNVSQTILIINNIRIKLYAQVTILNISNFYTVIWFQEFQSNTNNLPIIIQFQVFLSTTSNLQAVILFQISIPIS